MKSYIKKVKVYDYIFHVQINRNGGICNITVPHDVKVNERFKQRKLYQLYRNDVEALRSEMLNTFQGRLIADPYVKVHLYNLLRDAL